MPQTELLFYKEGETVLFEQWLNTLPVKVQAKCLSHVRLLRAQGHELRRPISDYLRDCIYEIRPTYQGVNYRILYFLSGMYEEIRGKPKGTRMGRSIMSAKQKDGLDQLIDKFVEGNPERQAMLDDEIVNVEAAQLVYDLRKKAGLSQRELAKRVGTTASVICRMEQADYEGSLPMLRRIAGALNRRLELRAVPIKSKATQKIARAS